MNTIDAIYKRRAIKHFDPQHRLTTEEEQKLFEATIQSPTSFNIQHWRFVVIRDDALRMRIRKEVGNDQAQMTDASLLVVFTADVKAWEKSPERYWANAPKQVAEMLTSWIRPFYEGRDWLQRDEVQRSMGMAMQTMMLAATGMGYESCPMVGFDIDGVARMINLPDDHVMGPMVAIGKGTKPAWPKPGQLPLSELLYENSF